MIILRFLTFQLRTHLYSYLWLAIAILFIFPKIAALIFKYLLTNLIDSINRLSVFKSFFYLSSGWYEEVLQNCLRVHWLKDVEVLQSSQLSSITLPTTQSLSIFIFLSDLCTWDSLISFQNLVLFYLNYKYVINILWI